MSPKLEWLPSDMPSFAGCPRCQDLRSLDAEVAIIGIPYRSPYAVSTPLRGVGSGRREEYEAACRRPRATTSRSMPTGWIRRSLPVSTTPLRVGSTISR